MCNIRIVNSKSLREAESAGIRCYTAGNILTSKLGGVLSRCKHHNCEVPWTSFSSYRMMIGTEKRRLRNQALPTSMRALLPAKKNDFE